MSLDRPPSDVPAEMALLGSLIMDQQMIGEAVQILSGPDDFSVPNHGVLYTVLEELWNNNGATIDAVTLADALRAKGLLEQVGGVSKLIELGESVPHALGAPAYARIVADKGLRRRALEVVVEATETLSRPDSRPTAEILDTVESDILAISDATIPRAAIGLGATLKEAYDELEAREGPVGLPTGLPDLDRQIGGMCPGEMIVIAARPSVGKTALGLQISLHIAESQNLPVVMFSMEMARMEIGMRILSMLSGVDGMKMRRNDLVAEEYIDLASACGRATELPFYLDCTTDLRLVQLRAKARRFAQMYKVKLICVDYLTLLEAPGESIREQVVACSKGIKNMAKELNVPVLCLAQLNRQPESRTDHRPRISDLRESGTIEQDADIVILLHREDVAKHSDPEHVKTGEAELNVAKHRNGMPGIVKATFDDRGTKFNSVALSGDRNYPY
jgi:replicative DNA helicase